MLPHKQIQSRLQAAVRAVLPDADVSSVLIRPCPDPKFGDYQSNALMSLAKARKLNPRQLAADVLAKVDVSEICEKVEIAGAGFLNFRLKSSELAKTLESAARGEHLFFEKCGGDASSPSDATTGTSRPRTIVIDFSSPNVAKPMHVGHIRSTGIGDALQRTLRLLGHRVITDNHIGDWGTQFGKLLFGWKHFLDKSQLESNPLEEFEFLYKTVNFICEEFDSTARIVLQCLSELEQPGNANTFAKWKVMQTFGADACQQKWSGNIIQSDYVDIAAKTLSKCGLLDWESSQMIAEKNFSRFKKILIAALRNEFPPPPLAAAKSELVKLQSGDVENVSIWKEMIVLSQKQFDEIYSRLAVKFDHALGESFYNPWLGEVVEDLLKRGIARESEGAVGVFSDGSLPPKEDPFLVNRDGEWIADPALVRKSDGGFNYTTTDLATIDYRLKTWSPDEIVYVVDDRQSGHFKKLFATFARWKSDAAKTTKLIHVGFGKILGDDGKPFKTRSGDTVKLGDLLDEAEERAFKIVSEKSVDLPESQRREIARVVGIGAVKYADLLPNRQSDYVFSWDKMLALQGNTAPYLQYAYARIKSIFRKAELPAINYQLSTINLLAPEELALAKHLLNFGLTLEAVAEEYRPNFLCNYLYELAGKFTSFYENCPVLKADDATRASRLALCDLTARVLKQGLETLGIETVEQM